MKFIEIYRNIKRSFIKYKPLIEVTISSSALTDNLKEYQKKYKNLIFAPVLKSNAYGHGLLLVAKRLANENIAFLVLDSLYEAMVLRNEGIMTKILIVGFTSVENIINTKISNIAFTVTSLEHLQYLNDKAKSLVKIHLKIDTGMHRQGVLISEVDEAINIIKGNSKIFLEGICSHLADADNADSSFTLKQIDRWNQVVEKFETKFENIKYIDIAATAGTHYSQKARGNVARLGLGLYGINPSPLVDLDLRPVMEIRTQITSVRKLDEGEGVGYNLTQILHQESEISTIPVGYFEGIDRRLSGKGSLTIDGANCPIVGRISMNITSIDVSKIKDVKIGKEVIVLSRNRSDVNSVENIAKIAQTIPYEILVHIPQHLRRVVVA